MKQKSLLLSLLCVLLLGLSACSDNDSAWEQNEENGGSTEVVEDETANEEDETADTGDEELVPNTQDIQAENAVTIAFSEDAVLVDNPYDGNGVFVESNGGHVTITSTLTDTELNYVVSGITTDGSLKIYGSYKFGLMLNGVGITNPQGAAINIQCKKKITVTVVDATNNRLIDGESYTYVDGEDMKATFFSEGQLNFYGTGLLEVRGKNKHAICVDDYFRLHDGHIVVKEAASDAIHANDYIRIDDGKLTLRATGEGLDCEEGYVAINGGTVNITTLGEKGQGVKAKTELTVTAGTVGINVHGKAAKCLKSGGDMQIAAGTLKLTTAGDAFYDTGDADISSAAGIKCDGNLQIDGGTLTISSSGAGGKGISVDGTLTINDGTLQVTTTGGLFKYGTDDTAAKAIKSDGDLTVNNGSITIKTTAEEAEGLESKSRLYINGGQIEIEAYDDCINASEHIEITGGNIYCYSTTNDGIDSNGTLTVTGGVIVSIGSTAPEEGFDCDNNQFKITGGVLIGTGGATSTPTAGVCTQRSLVYKPTASNVQLIRIASTTAGAEVLTFKLPRTYGQQMTLLFSSPDLLPNTGYTIYSGGSVSGGTEFHGYYKDAAYSPGSTLTTFTTTSVVTTVGTTTGGPGGNGGGW